MPPDSPTTDSPASPSEQTSTGGSGYAAAKQRESKLPKTGDETGRTLSMIAGIAVLAGIAILVVAMLARRRRKNA